MALSLLCIIALYDIAWSSLDDLTRSALTSKDPLHIDLVMHILKAFNEQLKDDSETKTRLMQLIVQSAIMITKEINVHFSSSGVTSVENDLGALDLLISNFSETLFTNNELASVCQSNVYIYSKSC